MHGLVLDDNHSATLINELFVNLTKDFPPVKNEWFDLECPDNFPAVSVEDVRIELMKMNKNKAPGPNDPFREILKIFEYSLQFP